MKRVTIIGAGIGGLSAACQLACYGYDVTVIEKHSHAGGRNGQINKNGFSFDIGASFIMAKEIYEDFFLSMGEDINRYIKFDSLKETSRFFLPDSKILSLSTDMSQVKKQLSQLFPGNEHGFDKYLKITKDIHDVVYKGPKMGRRNFYKLFGLDYIFDPQVILNIHKFNLFRSWGKTVSHFFNDEYLQMIFSYQSLFMGMKPDDALGVYAFLSWLELHEGLFTVKGGVYGLIEGIYQLALDKGVKFIFNTEVTKLNYYNHKITNIEAGELIIETDIVVNNSDGAYFYTNLMPNEKNYEYTVPKLEKIKHTNSFFNINLGLKSNIAKLGHHNIFLSDNLKENFNLVFQKDSVTKFNSSNTSFYLCHPTVTETKLAPPGKGVLFLLIPVYGNDKDFNWDQYENTFKNFAYDLIDEKLNINIRELIEEEIIFSPSRWGKEYNLWRNITLGFSHNFMQVNNFRMPNKDKYFNNLYMVGSSTIPGAGMPTCVTSGELATQRIIKDYPI